MNNNGAPSASEIKVDKDRVAGGGGGRALVALSAFLALAAVGLGIWGYSEHVRASRLTAPTSTMSTIWSTYHNNQYGFTFEYPTAYDKTSYKDSCGLKENSDGIHLGHQIDLLFLESNGLDLTEYANSLLQSKGWTSDSVKNVTINGLEAVTVEYRFGGTNRFGAFTLIEHNTRFFALNFLAGSFCDIPEAQVSEPEVYSHMLETFQLAP